MVLSTVCSVIFIPNFQFSIRYVSSYRKALELIWNFKMTWNESLIKIPKQYAYNSIQKYTQSLLRGKKKNILSSWFLQQHICLLTNNVSKIINKSKAWLSYNTSCIYWHFPPALRKASVAQHIYSVPGCFTGTTASSLMAFWQLQEVHRALWLWAESRWYPGPWCSSSSGVLEERVQGDPSFIPLQEWASVTGT